jgi:hypothetical protein
MPPARPQYRDFIQNMSTAPPPASPVPSQPFARVGPPAQVPAQAPPPAQAPASQPFAHVRPSAQAPASHPVAAPAQPSQPALTDRASLLGLYADYLARVDDESAQALRDGLERSYPQGSPQAGLLAVLLSTPYQDLLKSAAQVEQRIISTLFNEMAVHVDYLQPEHELRDKNVIPALHSHVLVDMRQSVTDAGCLRAFESICASRRDSFNVRFLLLGIHETLLFAGGIVLGAKDPARQLKNLLEMVGTVSPMLARCACTLCLHLVLASRSMHLTHRHADRAPRTSPSGTAWPSR